MSAAALHHEITQFAEGVEIDYNAVVDDLDAEALAFLLAAIRDCRQDLAALYKRVEADLMNEAGEKRFVVEGLGEVQIKKSTKRTQWRHSEMLAAVIARVMEEPATIYDEGTGELLPYMTIGHNVTERLRDCVSLGAGKVTGLRAIGLQPDEFCHEEDGGYNVALPAREAV